MGVPDLPLRLATAPKHARRAPSGCAMGDLLRLLGESHVLDLLYVFLNDPRPRRFVELQTQLKMSPNTLSDRLRSLVGCGLLTRTAYSEIPPRVEYAPTKKAVEFDAVFKSLSAWARHNTLEPVVQPAP